MYYAYLGIEPHLPWQIDQQHPTMQILPTKRGSGTPLLLVEEYGLSRLHLSITCLLGVTVPQLDGVPDTGNARHTQKTENHATSNESFEITSGSDLTCFRITGPKTKEGVRAGVSELSSYDSYGVHLLR